VKKLTLIILCLLTYQFCFGQNKQIDSLKNELSKTNIDTIKVLIYEKLMRAAPNGKAAIKYGLQGLELAKRIRYAKGEILCGNGTGFIMVQLDPYSAIPILMATKDLCEKTNNQLQLVGALGSLGYAYGYVDYKKALFYFRECEKLMEKTNVSENILPITTILGYHYKDHGNLDTALIYLQKGYQLSLKSDKYPIRPNNFDRHFGEVYYKKGQKDLAMRYFRQSIVANKEKTDGQTYYGIALILQDKNQLDSAKFYARKSLELEQKDKRINYIILSANLLFELYRQNPAEALKYHLIATASKDSLFNQEKGRQIEKLSYEEREKTARNQRRIEAHQTEFENRVKIYALSGLILGLMIFAFVLYRNNKNKQKANALLHSQKEEIDLQRNKAENALSELKSTQAQLIQKEKLASLGELTAGIAHEIQNPLNFVNNFSELSVDLAKDINEELHKPDIDKDYVEELLSDLNSNQEKINLHGKRASSIVKGMLEHSRTSTGERELTDINQLADEYLRLSYHGMRAKDKNFQADYELIAYENLPLINCVPQEIGRVLLNLINNAFWAVNERSKKGIVGYEPKVTISTFPNAENQLLLTIKDNGNGIPQNILDKIFQPFFTTNPTGQGIGLGLSLSYDIVKAHGGELTVETKEGKGSTFIVKIPIQSWI
jgi:signal transduction histidine kinase